MNLIKKSVFLSFVLRHKPEEIGIVLTIEGWTNIDTLITQAIIHNTHLTKDMITEIVNMDKKRRYQISSDGSSIRAVQGHSTKMVNLTFCESIPPSILYHGTSDKYINSIKNNGLQPQTRQYVHLSTDINTAKDVGLRHTNISSDMVVLEIDTLKMIEENIKFYLSDNNVWLVTNVAPKYIVKSYKFW